MGVMLTAVRATGNGPTTLHVDSRNWGILRDLLIDLGIDAEAMPDEHGAVVGEGEASFWFESLCHALEEGHVRAVTYEDDAVAGGERVELRLVRPGGEDRPEDAVACRLMRALGVNVINVVVTGPSTGVISTEPLTSEPELEELLFEFGLFCGCSGGFLMWMEPDTED